MLESGGRIYLGAIDQHAVAALHVPDGQHLIDHAKGSVSARHPSVVQNQIAVIIAPHDEVPLTNVEVNGLVAETEATQISSPELNSFPNHCDYTQ